MPIISYLVNGQNLGRPKLPGLSFLINLIGRPVAYKMLGIRGYMFDNKDLSCIIS